MYIGIIPSIPDGFKRRLREIKQSYGVRFNRKVGHWEITDKTKYGREYVLTSVCNDNGTYRPLCGGLIDEIKRILWKNTQLRKMLLEGIEQGKRNEASRERQFSDDSYQLGKDLYRPMQMMARDLGYDSGKSRIPTIQGADLR